MNNTVHYRVYFDWDGTTWYTDTISSLDEVKSIYNDKLVDMNNSNVRVIKETINYEEIII